MEKYNQLGVALFNLSVLTSFVEKHIGIKRKMKYNCNISGMLMAEYCSGFFLQSAVIEKWQVKLNIGQKIWM